jgi:hypothetical protein
MATVALSTLRSQLQTFLRDTDAKKWTADDLDSFLNLAITQWTTDLPIATSVDYAVVSGQHEYEVPSNAVSVKWVRGYFENSSTLEFIGPMSVEPGTWASLDEPRRFILQFPTETQFYLPRLPSGSAFTLYYGATHDPLSGDGAVLNLRNQRWGELAVLAYAAHLAFLPYAASRSRLEQWATKQDLKVGNPLQEQAKAWLEKYNQLMDEHSGPATFEFLRLERS